jgi:hypothetical protein
MNRTICRMLLVSVIGMAAALAFADTESFDQARPGTLPPGWECGVTGRASCRQEAGSHSKRNGFALATRRQNLCGEHIVRY